MTRAIVALGSNLGDRVDYLDAAIAAFDDVHGLTVLAVSPWYESIAHTVTGPDANRPRYLNGAALIDTALSPIETLHALLQLEALLGRPSEHAPWSDRTLDLDLIVFDGITMRTPELTLPHPRAHERVFVLQPWWDIEPDAEIAEHGPIALLLEQCPADERAALSRVGAR